MKCVSMILPVVVSSLMLAGCGNKPAAETPANNAPKADAPAPAAVQKTEAAAPDDGPKNPDDLIASVNGKKFLRKDMDQLVEAMMKFYEGKIPAEQLASARKDIGNRAAYSFIMKTILLEQAEKEKIQVTDEDRKTQTEKMAEQLKPQGKTVEQFFKESPLGEEAAKKEFEEGLLIDKLITVNVIDKLQITDDECKAEIAKIEAANKEIEEKNKNLETEKANARKKIEEIKKRVTEGKEDFGEVAEKESDCPSKAKKGDLGPFPRGQMVKAFEDAAFSQEVGKVGDIVETPFGFHLIKVTAKTPAVEAKGDTPAQPEKVTASHILVKVPQAMKPRPVPTLEQMKEQVKQVKSRDAIRPYVDGLKKAAKIETTLPDIQEMLK
ncbi:MAG: peptidylprolyl isomerase [Kiritimatiellae bacterium]|nr:peptidylprolyl isomerase [Kiritimatiellia bacterium]